ncbi:MAG: DUF4293 domain-containing protein [Saprospiraceae bacterium]
MIQRIQSIYLILAVAALGLQFVFPFASSPESMSTATAMADGVFNLNDSMILLISTGVALALAVFAVFLFKNRPVQSRITSLGMFASTILAVALAVQYILLLQQMGPSSTSMHLQAGIGMPALSVFMLWLANRAIRKDEALVRSSDRLR